MVNQYTVKRPVAVCYCGEHAWLKLTRGYVTFIEPADAKFVGQWSWSALYRNGRDPRAVRRENADGKMRYLHRELVPSKIVDHKDGNTLNNRRSNLRPCSQLENNWNAKPRSGKSKFKGVSLCRKTGRWTADIRAKRRYRLGRFDTEEEAARAYDAKAIELHGTFARTNLSLGLLPQEG